jgi:hypothetical protein
MLPHDFMDARAIEMMVSGENAEILRTAQNGSQSWFGQSQDPSLRSG